MDHITWFTFVPYIVWLVATVMRSVHVSRGSTSRLAYYTSTTEFALRYTAAPLHVIAHIVKASSDPNVWGFVSVLILLVVVVFIAHNQWKLRDKNYWFHGRYSDGKMPLFVRLLRRRSGESTT